MIRLAKNDGPGRGLDNILKSTNKNKVLTYSSSQ